MSAVAPAVLGLVKYDHMVVAIRECHDVDEVKDIRDRARAVELYSAQAQNLEAEMRAMEIRIRAERRAGQLLKEMKDAGQRQKPGDTRPDSNPELPSLADMGISKKQSSDWQKMAEIPEEEFEKTFATGELATTKGLVRKAEPKKKAKRNKQRKYALAIWSRLRDLPSLFPLRELPAVVRAMDDRVRGDILEVIPDVEQFLRRLKDELKKNEQ